MLSCDIGVPQGFKRSLVPVPAAARPRLQRRTNGWAWIQPTTACRDRDGNGAPVDLFDERDGTRAAKSG